MLAARPLCGLVAATLLTASALALPGASHAQRLEDPDLFLKSAEAAFGTLAVYGPYDAPEEMARLQRIGYLIAQHSGYETFPFSFHLVDMAIPNAFALPAGHIFITRGMLDLGLDDDMLAGLLGHEVAHVTQEHFLRMKKRATLFNALSQVLSLGAIYGASQMGGDTWVDPYGYTRTTNVAGEVAQGLAAGSMVLSEMLLRSYSRAHEDEADEEGQRFAAAAGFDPEGTQRLMDKMERRLPQEQSFGYWQTHPFFEERARAARARKGLFKTLEPKPGEDYRRRTQQVLLDYVGEHRLEPPAIGFMIENTALRAWPQGELAEGIRHRRLERRRDAELSRPELERDYGRLLARYDEELAEVRELTPDSPFLATTGAERERIDQERRGLYPRAVEQIDSEVTPVALLATFLSNYPDSDRVPEVAMLLGESYARLRREPEAVENFLVAWESDPTGPRGERARRGLRRLVGYLERLAAVQQLADQPDDDELRALAEQRLAEVAESYDDLSNGGEYLRAYSQGPWIEAVRRRQEALADEIYKEVVLYQRVGDHAKAVAGIETILTWAPLSSAARQLSEDRADEAG